MNYKNTEKLFFKKYAYKVAVDTPLASIFRTKNISDLKDSINELYLNFEKNSKNQIKISKWLNRYASVDDVHTANQLVLVLENIDSYVLRIEGYTISVFFNDTSVIDSINSITGIKVREIHKPKTEKIKEFLLANPISIVKPTYTHKFKVHLKGLRNDSVSFKEWASKYSKIKLVDSNTYKFEGYFYVEDDRTLTMCRLYLNNNIRKVEKIYKETEI
jgi:hypothetical protein